MTTQQLPDASQFELLLNLQYGVNTKAVGSDIWTTDHYKYNYVSAIRQEVDEASKSTGWKLWWKKDASQLDRENLHMELVDIYHFLLSRLIQVEHQHDMTQIAKRLAHRVVSIQQYIEKNDMSKNTDVKHPEWADNFENTLNHFLADCVKSTENAVFEFFWLCHYAGLQVQELHSIYLLKNALNRFRASNGYKTGEYQKMWSDDQEDNFWVLRERQFLGSTDLTPEALYAVIQRLYKFHTGRDGK